MWFLSRHFRKLNQRYHGPEGDAFAIEELAPVARRFLPRDGRVPEVGRGHGRDLVALSGLPDGIVIGSDVAFGELARAKAERLAPLDPERRATRVYFADCFASPWRGLAGSRVAAKRVIFALAARIHAVLSLFGSSADLILPSLRVVWQVEKRG